MNFGEKHPELEYFADKMRTKLEDNSHKLEKPRLPIRALLKKLRIEVEELAVAIDHETAQDAMWECVDVANFAMLIWKRLYHQGDIDRIREDAAKATLSPVVYSDQVDKINLSKQAMFSLNASDFYYAKDFEVQGVWSPQDGVDIMMWRHKPTGTTFFEDHERTKALSGALIMPNWVREYLPK